MNSKELREKFEELMEMGPAVRKDEKTYIKKPVFPREYRIEGKLDLLMEAMCELLDRSELNE